MNTIRRTILGTATLLLFACVWTSCGGDDDGTSDGLSIEILSPEDGAIFSQSDTINIMYRVTTDMDISTIAFFNATLGTGSVNTSELSGENDTSYSGSFLISANADPGEYTISITATETGDDGDIVDEDLVVNIQ